MNYVEIHRLYNEGFSKSAIAKKLKVSRNMVIDYLNMTTEEFEELLSSLRTREKKLDRFQDQILEWLREHPDLSAAQIYDWLEEKFNFKEVAENTVRNYLNEMRDRYQIPKVITQRTYATVPELPMGKQAQVDFGQTIVKNIDGQNKRLYFIAVILSHSRFKYVEWLERPFRTADVIRMHENAFHYFEGMPEEIVYDQDALLAVSENAGDLILVSSITRSIQKDNVIRYNGNRYSVPKGTFRSDAPNIAYVQEDEGWLIIRLKQTGSILAKHRISSERGLVISDPVHRETSTSKRELLIQQLEDVFLERENIQWLIEALKERYPRHLNDQLKVLLQTIKTYPNHCEQALKEIRKLKMTSANDFRDIAHSLSIRSQKDSPAAIQPNPKYRDLIAPERSQDIYLKILSGGRS
ncbi:IS21 family transposase [Psychrobacillus sp. NPDC096426]|uniref:IS21 family transposase n=1 Tax=Psychrobacillus sp. NPDC096426 TaxID=3364491 RepID=UPI0038209A4E